MAERSGRTFRGHTDTLGRPRGRVPALREALHRYSGSYSTRLRKSHRTRPHVRMSRRKPEPPTFPSRVTVPKRAHPAAKIVFAEMRRQNVSYQELEFRSGVLMSTFKAWRTHNSPGLETMQAALGSLGWEFLAVPRLENIPPAVRALLMQAADQWGSDDDLLCELLAMIATKPRLDRARRLAKATPIVSLREPLRPRRTPLAKAA